ncbi:MAG: hypothetical protein M1493_04530 [Firmicutes bacterium]|nr:hypothetical protein [Bacillota bacterium]
MATHWVKFDHLALASESHSMFHRALLEILIQAIPLQWRHPPNGFLLNPQIVPGFRKIVVHPPKLIPVTPFG